MQNTIPLRYAERAKQVPGASNLAHVSWVGGKVADRPKEVFTSLAADPESFLAVEGELKVSPEDKARWLSDKRGALVGSDLARSLGLKVGDALRLVDGACPGTWDLTVDAVYTTKYRSTARRMVVFPWQYFNEGCPPEQRDQIGWLEVRVADPSEAGSIANAIDRVFAQESQQTVTTSERASNLAFLASLNFVLRALDFVAGLTLVILAMIIGNTLSTSVRERAREIASLRAIGFGKAEIGRLVALEALVIGALIGGLAIAASYPIVEVGIGSWLTARMPAFFPSFQIERETHAAVLGASVCFSLALSLVLGWFASSKSIVLGLRRVA